MDAASKRREGRMEVEEDECTSPALCCAAARGGGVGSIGLDDLLRQGGEKETRRQLAFPCNLLLAWALVGRRRSLRRKESHAAPEHASAGPLPCRTDLDANCLPPSGIDGIRGRN